MTASIQLPVKILTFIHKIAQLHTFYRFPFVSLLSVVELCGEMLLGVVAMCDFAMGYIVAAAADD